MVFFSIRLFFLSFHRIFFHSFSGKVSYSKNLFLYFFIHKIRFWSLSKRKNQISTFFTITFDFWLIDWATDWVSEWVSDWLIDWLIGGVQFRFCFSPPSSVVCPTWQSRTYSSHASWITGQAMDIGVDAIAFLIDTWEGHLTPKEVAHLADKASRSSDRKMGHGPPRSWPSPCSPHGAQPGNAANPTRPRSVQRTEPGHAPAGPGHRGGPRRSITAPIRRRCTMWRKSGFELYAEAVGGAGGE